MSISSLFMALTSTGEATQGVKQPEQMFPGFVDALGVLLSGAPPGPEPPPGLIQLSGQGEATILEPNAQSKKPDFLPKHEKRCEFALDAGDELSATLELIPTESDSQAAQVKLSEFVFSHLSGFFTPPTVVASPVGSSSVNTEGANTRISDSAPQVSQGQSPLVNRFFYMGSRPMRNPSALPGEIAPMGGKTALGIKDLELKSSDQMIIRDPKQLPSIELKSGLPIVAVEEGGSGGGMQINGAGSVSLEQDVHGSAGLGRPEPNDLSDRESMPKEWVGFAQNLMGEREKSTNGEKPKADAPLDQSMKLNGSKTLIDLGTQMTSKQTVERTPKSYPAEATPGTQDLEKQMNRVNGQKGKGSEDAPKDNFGTKTSAVAKLSGGIQSEATQQGFSVKDFIDELKNTSEKPVESKNQDFVVHAPSHKTVQSTVQADLKPELRLDEPIRNRIVQQVADRVEALAAANPKNGVVVHLDPRDLGHLTLIVKSSGSEVDAQIFASHEAVAHAIEQSKQQLTQNLEQRGLNLSSVNVSHQDLAQNSFAGQHRHAQEEQRNNSFTYQPSSRTESMNLQEVRRSIAKTQGVDVWI